MKLTATILESLDFITHETTRMLQLLDAGEPAVQAEADRREVKRRVLEIHGKTHELFDWLSAARLEDPRN